ncbi:adenosylmethionine--8-amino-7-oxononanoate transaminase [Leptolyngbya sp. FACHB-321]|uniref:adenosylmethionine--8-amino-7-oxononanoate transaminase n=1 Tax=Leptolyngbya sp. FACHB-321 TaxID=2692807 RepID=UPI00168936C6|nr:adenosylmethionine--8-amino-7-oxononanoate transaminase [Leptolyngbya sp. FACHB-321]MBD2036358.1 adenosylmethionine--8-amino-7-oxononanoate transaminase [Leptolyngbya sp. FACHB-321]
MHPNIWYPYTQAKTAPEPLKVKAAQGAWLELETGERILDCISSWWVNLHGHAHPKIAEAIFQQAKHLEHVIFAGFTHDPAEQLAEKLVSRLPSSLSRVFYSDNGSTAVEVALKMAYQYWTNQGQPRSTFLAFEGAYHGDTFGAMAVGARSLFSQAFAPLLFEVEFVPYPIAHSDAALATATEQTILDEIAQKLSESGDRYAGIIIEPLVQGASGMRMGRSQFLQQLQELAYAHNTLLIFDEVMTGFGRTGDWFACTKTRVEPDILCLSKGITGGFLPLSVTVCSEAIYNAFYSDDPLQTLYHGHSYAANPLGCAAGLASLELMVEHEPAFQQMEAKHRQHLAALSDHPRLTNLRVTGTIAAMDIITDQPGYLSQLSIDIRHRSIAQGLLLRPLGNVLYLMPPYCITDDELAFIYRGLGTILNELT